MKFYIIRHSIQEDCSLEYDQDLSYYGIKLSEIKAKELDLLIDNEECVKFISSPQKTCIQTCNIYKSIIKNCNNEVIESDTRLEHYNSKSSILTEFDIKSRVNNFINSLLSKPDNTYIIITHGKIFNEIVKYFIPSYKYENQINSNKYIPSYCEYIGFNYDGSQVNYLSDNITHNSEVVIYHGGCMDGFFGAYASYLRYKDSDIDINNINYIGLGHQLKEEVYDMIIEQCVDKHVVSIDISPPYEVSKKIISVAKSFKILDHHVTAQKDLENIHPFYKNFNMKKSGAVLGYEYYFTPLHAEDMQSNIAFSLNNPPIMGGLNEKRCKNLNKIHPISFKFIQDRDLWSWEFKELSEPFTTALFSKININRIENHNEKFKELDNLINTDDKINTLIDIGKCLLDFKQSIIDGIINRAKYIKIKNLPEFINFKGMIINSTSFSSEIGNILSSTKCDYAIIYSHEIDLENNDIWYCSIRSNTDECNVSKIAKHFGGGGHIRASGFRIKGKLTDYIDFIDLDI